MEVMAEIEPSGPAKVSGTGASCGTASGKAVSEAAWVKRQFPLAETKKMNKAMQKEKICFLFRRNCLILWFKKLIFICFLISALLLYLIMNDSLNGSSLRPVMKTAI